MQDQSSVYRALNDGVYYLAAVTPSEQTYRLLRRCPTVDAAYALAQAMNADVDNADSDKVETAAVWLDAGVRRLMDAIEELS